LLAFDPTGLHCRTIIQQVLQFLERGFIERSRVAIDEVNIGTGERIDRDPCASQLLL
jgi:hypothetical protein